MKKSNKLKQLLIIIAAFLSFIGFGAIIWQMSDHTTTGYDITKFQPLFATITIGWVMHIVVVWMLSFNFREIKEYAFSYRSKLDFRELTNFQKICISLFLYLALFYFLVAIYGKIA